MRNFWIEQSYITNQSSHFKDNYKEHRMVAAFNKQDGRL